MGNQASVEPAPEAAGTAGTAKSRRASSSNHQAKPNAVTKATEKSRHGKKRETSRRRAESSSDGSTSASAGSASASEGPSRASSTSSRSASAPASPSSHHNPRHHHRDKREGSSDHERRKGKRQADRRRKRSRHRDRRDEASSDRSRSSRSASANEKESYRGPKKDKRRASKEEEEEDNSSNNGSASADPAADDEQDGFATYGEGYGHNEERSSYQNSSSAYGYDAVGGAAAAAEQVQDETVVALFQLLPFFRNGDASAKQLARATLATVRPRSIDARDADGNTLLLVACQNACHALVDPMLAKGADPAAANASGVCALHYACYSDTLSVAAAASLLRFGASPTCAELTYGCTPLHYAASAGDAALCQLLLEHGADPTVQDYYNYTAVNYARDAGHEELAKTLARGGAGGFDDGAAAYPEEQLEPDNGLWTRQNDPSSGAAYHLNSATGESWWENDLLSQAHQYLSSAAAGGAAAAAADLAPGVRSWLRQQQARTQLVALFARNDPLRLTEVEQLMEASKGSFDGMFDKLIKEYGITDRAFMATAFALPEETENGYNGNGNGNGTLMHGATGFFGDYADNNGDETVGELDLASLDALDAPRKGSVAILDMEGVALDAVSLQALEELAATHRRELEDDREQHGRSMAQREAAADVLEQRLKEFKSRADTAQQQLAALEVRRERLARGSTDGSEDSPEKLEERLAKLKGDIAAERAMFEHLTHAMQELKGSTDERKTERARADAERAERLLHAEAEAEREAERLTAESSVAEEELNSTWALEKASMTARLEAAVAAARAALEETQSTAASALSKIRAEASAAEAAAKTHKDQVDACRDWMRQNGPKVAEASKMQVNNRTLHAQLRREMERAKHLHNQMEDMRGRCRVVARIRPANEREQGAGCKEACFRDGKKAVGFTIGERRIWDFDAVLQAPAASDLAAANGANPQAQQQRELFAEFAPLATSLADGHNVVFLAAGGGGSGKTFTLQGPPPNAMTAASAAADAARGCEDVPTSPSASPAGPAGAAAATGGRKKSQASIAAAAAGTSAAAEAVAGICSGVLPRLLAEAFRVLSDREAQSAFRVAVAVGLLPAERGSAPIVALNTAAGAAAAAGAGGGESQATNSGANGEEKQLKERQPRKSLTAQGLADVAAARGPWGGGVRSVESAAEALRALQADTASLLVGKEGSSRGLFHVAVWVHVVSVNRSTKEATESELLSVDLCTLNGSGSGGGGSGGSGGSDAWAAELAAAIRSHAVSMPFAEEATNGGESRPLPALIATLRPRLLESTKLVTLLCLSPADTDAIATTATLTFGDACRGEVDSGAQLRELKRELARLKKGGGGGGAGGTAGDAEAGGGGAVNEGAAARKAAPPKLPRPPTAGKSRAPQ